MGEETRNLQADCFLRPLVDAKSTNISSSHQSTKPNVKVEMQLLRLPEEVQNQILSDLKFIYGQEFELGTEDDYRDKGNKMQKNLWKDRGQLVIQGGCDYSNYLTSTTGDDNRMRMYGLLKLESYGFHKPHCFEVLEAFNDNIDDSINFLFEKYFPTSKHKKVTDCNLSENELLEMRADEKEALESIYDKQFTEIEKNHIWQLKLKLDYLFIHSPSELKKIQKEKQQEIERKLAELQNLKKKKPEVKVEKCKNLLKIGKCKYKEKCRFSHNIYQDDNGNTSNVNNQRVNPKNVEDDQKTWLLEIRFPQWCKYPYEAPIILLRTKIADIPKSICLRINQRLIDESRLLAIDGVPSVYSIIDLLQMNEDILDYLNKNFMFKYPSPDLSIFDYDPNAEDEETVELNLPTHYEQGRTSKTDKRILTPEQLLKENMQIIRRFRDKGQNTYYQEMLKKRMELPAWFQKDEIISTISKNQISVIVGATGCGKSTQIPQFILDEWLENAGKCKISENENIEIICTQPRRISAIGVAERVADERNEKVGNVVGYQIRLENKVSSATRLTFCTTGILLRRLYSDPLLENVTHLILDEVHERSEESDFLLLILKEMLKQRQNLKVVLMSATVNAEIFSRYFDGAPVLNIPGRTFPVEQLFLEDILDKCGFVLEPDSNFCKKISKKDEEQLMQELEYADITASNVMPSRSIRDENLKLSEVLARYSANSKTTCKSLFLMDPIKINPELIESILTLICDGGSKEEDWPQNGTVLIFLPGLAEIQSVFDSLMDSKEFSSRSGKYLLLPLHSSLTNEEQALVFKRAPNAKRKIILSTNIAETSITIDDCVFVIDCGQMKEKHFDSNRNMESLETTWISKANASQRQGRAGRVMAGISIHLFTKHRYNNHLLNQPVPEIHRVPLEQLLLRIKTLPSFHGQALHSVLRKAIEPPVDENISSAIKRLQNLGAFEKENLTPLGYHISSLPVDVRIGKLMLFGAIFQCFDSVLTIAASLSYKSPFVSPFSKRNEADKRKRMFAIGCSDHLTVLNAYKKWREANKRSRYAGRVFSDENYISCRTMEMLGEIKYQFLELLVSIGFVPIDMPRTKRSRGAFDDNILELTGNELNSNGNNSRLLAAVLCAALYPNIVKVLTPEKNYTMGIGGAMPREFLPTELRFKTKDDGFIALHPSSINSTVGSFYSPFLIFQEKVKTSKIFIRECTIVPVIAMILFSGNDLKIELHNGSFFFFLEDNWIVIQADSLKTAELIKFMRKELMSVLEEKIKDPLLNLTNNEKSKRIITSICNLVSNY